MSWAAAATRYRTKPKPDRHDPAPQPVRLGPYLPARVLHERQQQRARMERAGVAYATGHEAHGRRVDQPLWGQTAVMPRDEREAKYDKPLLYVDHQPGKVIQIAVGAGSEYWQDLKDRVDEQRHYGQDRVERRPLPRHFYELVWHEICERRRRANRGAKTYGPATAGRRNRQHFKIVSGPFLATR